VNCRREPSNARHERCSNLTTKFVSRGRCQKNNLKGQSTIKLVLQWSAPDRRRCGRFRVSVSLKSHMSAAPVHQAVKAQRVRLSRRETCRCDLPGPSDGDIYALDVEITRA
jgi:hypothetical protein